MASVVGGTRSVVAGELKETGLKTAHSTRELGLVPIQLHTVVWFRDEH